jgi:hypothetical protein
MAKEYKQINITYEIFNYWNSKLYPAVTAFLLLECLSEKEKKVETYSRFTTNAILLLPNNSTVLHSCYRAAAS